MAEQSHREGDATCAGDTTTSIGEQSDCEPSRDDSEYRVNNREKAADNTENLRSWFLRLEQSSRDVEHDQHDAEMEHCPNDATKGVRFPAVNIVYISEEDEKYTHNNRGNDYADGDPEDVLF